MFMQYLGNIVTSTKISTFEFIKVANNLYEIDITLPTLIIGWGTVNLLYPNEELSVLNKQIDENICWTFSKYEKRTDYETDIIKFYNLIFEKLKQDVEFIFFNVILSSLSEKKELIKYLQTVDKKVIYIKNNSFIYICIKNKVIGFSLKDCEFLNINKEKIIYKLRNLLNSYIFYDDYLLSYKIKNLIGTNYFLIPYLIELKQ